MVRTARGEGGFMLAFVMGALLFIGIIGMALMMMTITAAKVGAGLAVPLEAYRSIDRALEESVQVVRSSPSRCDDVPMGPYDITAIDGTFVVDCQTLTSTSTERVHLLTVVSSTDPSAVVGRAQIKVTDIDHGSRVFGRFLLVCDWLMGRSEPGDLEGCPA